MVLFRLTMLMLSLLFAFTSFQPALLAQDEIEQIINRDPFDPDRGVKEEAQEEAPPPEPVEVVNEEHNMVLDGTIMFSKSQMAIITIDKPAVATSSTRNSRIRRVGIRNNRRAPIQRGGARLGSGDPGEEEGDNRPSGPETHTVYVGDELEGYKLTAVTTQTATLKKGAETIELRLFSGEKENRGGSKEANTVARPEGDSPTRPRAQRVPGGDPNPRATEAEKPDAEAPMKVPEQKFEKRERPKIKRQGSSSNFKM